MASPTFGKVIVTGGAGFIGSHLCEKLVEKGSEVHALDNLSGAAFSAAQLQEKGVVLHKVNLADSKATAKAFSQISPQTVFHLAANPAVNVGAEATRSHLNNNIVATYNALGATAASGAKKFVFTSTCTVYGRALQVPTLETETIKPISLYGATKACGEALASSFADNYAFSSTVLRYANVVGGRSRHGITYDFFNKLRKNPKQLEVLGDGKQNKSYVFVEDAIEATLLAAQKNAAAFNTFNIGSDDTLTSLQIAQIVSSAMGLSPKISCKGGQAWKGDVTKVLLDCSKMKKLGWKAKNNSRQAVGKTVEALV